ncbi:MAG: hypothetical protein V5A56_01430 [Halolamina sp.]
MDPLFVRSHHRVLVVCTDGSHRWSATVLEADGRPMAFDDRQAFAPAGDRLHAIRRTGVAARRHEPLEGLVRTPTAVGDSVAVRRENRATGLSRANDERRWIATVPDRFTVRNPNGHVSGRTDPHAGVTVLGAHRVDITTE